MVSARSLIFPWPIAAVAFLCLSSRLVFGNPLGDGTQTSLKLGPSHFSRLPDVSHVIRWPAAPISLAVGGDAHTFETSYFAINSDGTLLALSVHGAVRIYDLASLQVQHVLKGHAGRINHISWHPNSPQVLITASQATTAATRSAVRIWDLSTLSPTIDHLIDRVAKAAANVALELMPDERFGVTQPANDVEALRLINEFSQALLVMTVQRDIETGAALKGEIPSFGNSGFDTTGDCALFVDGTSVIMYNHLLQTTVLVLEGHTDYVMWAATSPDNTLIATSSWDQTVLLWNAVTGKLQHNLTDATNQNWGGSFSPEGEYIAVGSGDGNVRVWKVTTGELLHTFGGWHGWVRRVAFSPALSKQGGDEPLLAAAGASPNGDMACVYKIVSGTTMRCWTIDTPEDTGGWTEMGDIAWSRDGFKLGFKGSDSSLVVVSLQENKIWQFSSGKDSSVRFMASGTLAFSPDGRMVWSLDSDSVLRGWDLI